MRGVWVLLMVLLVGVSLFSALRWRNEASVQPVAVSAVSNAELEQEVLRLTRRREELAKEIKDLDAAATVPHVVPTVAACFDRSRECDVVVAVEAHTRRSLFNVDDVFPPVSSDLPTVVRETPFEDFASATNYHYARLRGYDFVEVDVSGAGASCRGLDAAEALLQFYKLVVFVGPRAYVRESTMDAWSVASACPGGVVADASAAPGPAVLVARRSPEAAALLAEWRQACAKSESSAEAAWRKQLCLFSPWKVGANGELFVRDERDTPEVKAGAVEAAALHSLHLIDCRDAPSATCVTPDYRIRRVSLDELRQLAAGGTTATAKS